LVEIKGGDKLQAALNELLKNASNAASVDVGFMGGATEPDGTSVALVAALNNYGTRNIPPRPFFNQAIDKNKGHWPINLGTALKKNGFNAATALGLLGLEVQSEIQDEIREMVSPPNAPSTIARKGFDKPLIDSSMMLKSVTLKVNTK
jgi:hypothetical protein